MAQPRRSAVAIAGALCAAFASAATGASAPANLGQEHCGRSLVGTLPSAAWWLCRASAQAPLGEEPDAASLLQGTGAARRRSSDTSEGPAPGSGKLGAAEGRPLEAGTGSETAAGGRPGDNGTEEGTSGSGVINVVLNSELQVSAALSGASGLERNAQSPSGGASPGLVTARPPAAGARSSREAEHRSSTTAPDFGVITVNLSSELQSSATRQASRGSTSMPLGGIAAGLGSGMVTADLISDQQTWESREASGNGTSALVGTQALAAAGLAALGGLSLGSSVGGAPLAVGLIICILACGTMACRAYASDSSGRAGGQVHQRSTGSAHGTGPCATRDSFATFASLAPRQYTSASLAPGETLSVPLPMPAASGSRVLGPQGSASQVRRSAEAPSGLAGTKPRSGQGQGYPQAMGEDTQSRLSETAIAGTRDPFLAYTASGVGRPSMVQSALSSQQLNREGGPTPPLCGSLVLPQHEAHLQIQLSSLQEVAASGGEFFIQGPLGNRLLRAVVRDRAAGRALDISMVSTTDTLARHAHVATVTTRGLAAGGSGASDFELSGHDGRHFGVLAQRGGHFAVVCPGRAAAVLLLGGDPASLDMSLTSGEDGKQVAWVGRSSGTGRSDRLEFRMRCGADTALVLSCVLALVVLA